jgi:hypothetical protein
MKVVQTKHTEREYGSGYSKKEQWFMPMLICKLTQKWKYHHLENSNHLHAYQIYICPMLI